MIRDTIYYLNKFNKYNKKKIHTIVLLSAFAAFIESISILLLIPLFELIFNQDNSGQINYISKIIFNLFDKAEILNNFSFIALLVFSGFLIKSLILYFILINIAKYKGEFYKNIRSKFYSLFSKMPYSFFQEIEVGNYTNLITEQSHKSFEGLNNFIQFCSLFISSLVYLIVLIAVSPFIVSTALVAGFLAFTYFKRINHKVKMFSLNLSNKNTQLSNWIVESLLSHKYLIATGQNSKMFDKINSKINDISKIIFNFGQFQALTQSIREPFILLFITILILIDIYLIKLQTSIIFVSLILLYRTLNSMISLQGNWQSFLTHVGALEIIDNQISKLEKIDVKKSNTLDKNKFYDFYDIEFKNVSFRYESRKNLIINNLNLKIPKNTFIFLLGSSGSGKSTFIDLAIGLLKPSDGKVFNNGKEIDYKKNIKLGFVPQTPQLLDDTIENNISFEFANKPMLDEKIKFNVIKAAKEAEIHDFIMSLPNGYNTILGDMGLGISGGQRQRLAIARELYRNPKIIVIDEGTNSLDKKTELKILNLLKSISKNITIIFSTHNQNLIQKNDKFIKLLNNKILTNL